MNSSRPLRVHLIHQGFADYVGSLIDGLVRPERVLGAGGDDGFRPIDLRVTTILSGDSPGVTLRDVPVDHHCVALPRFRDPRSLPKAVLALRRVLEAPCDVVHWQAAGNPWVDAAFAGLMSKHPTVVTVHDMQAHPGDRNALPGTFRAIRAVAGRSRAVIVHAPHIRQQGIDLGLVAERIHVVAHGELASRYLEPDRLPVSFPDASGLASEPIVLFFGRAQGYKGLDVLAAAMPEVVEKVPRARLVVAGAGPTLDEVFPAEQATPEWLTVLRGRIDDAGVVDVFTKAAVVALPYREASQSGVAALAAGFGRPVVASAVPGLRDIVDDGVTGYLVEAGSSGALADGLVQILSAPHQLEVLGAGAFELASGELSWRSIASRTVDIYHEVVDPGTGLK